MFKLLLALSLCLSLSFGDEDDKNIKKVYKTPNMPHDAFTVLTFESASDLQNKLIKSSAKKEGTDETIAKYDGLWAVEVEESSALLNDYALVLKSIAKHHAISWNLTKPVNFRSEDLQTLVIQYEVKFADGIDCGGAYIKLLSDNEHLDLHTFTDKTPYSIMFGPDKCGLDHKFHFIIRFRNPKNGDIEEKHAKAVTKDLQHYFTDKKTHLFTLVLHSDNSFERYIDQTKVQSGNLLTDMEPPINPLAEIDDPIDKRPADWDERENIPDPDATKPEDWDENQPEYIDDDKATKPEGWLDEESELIPDPNAAEPSDWDSSMDGDWEAPFIKNTKCEEAPGCGEWRRPQIKNPSFKGVWHAPNIPNPKYKGKWSPKKIPNPSYFDEKDPFRHISSVSAVGLELWSMSNNIVFDNFLIHDSMHEANMFARDTWGVKSNAERMADPSAQSVVDVVRAKYQENPLLVIAIGVVCTLPLLLCLWYVCRSTTRTPTSTIRKKTDAPTPDDEPTKYDATSTHTRTSNPPVDDAGEQEDELEGSNEDDDDDDDAVHIPSQADGDTDLPGKAATDLPGKAATDLPGKAATDLPGKAATESESNEDAGEESNKDSKQAVRKRRARKD